MGMSAGGSGSLNSEINVTPMVDIMLVLLIIFILVTPNLQEGVSVGIPKETEYAKEDKLISSQESLVVSVQAVKDRAGVVTRTRYYLGDKEYQLVNVKDPKDDGRQALSKVLKDELEKKSDELRVVYIKADVDADYGDVVNIIEVIRSEDAGGTKKIGLVADRRHGIKDDKIPN